MWGVVHGVHQMTMTTWGKALLALAVLCAGQLGVTVAQETALGQAALIEPTSVPTYSSCIQQTGSQCVGSDNVEAQAPFDASSACSPTTLYDSSGLLTDIETIASQVGSGASLQ